MAASMLVGVIAAFLAPEPTVSAARDDIAAEELALARRLSAERGISSQLARLLAWLQTAVVGPFADFIARFRWHALLLLALIATYRISDVVLGVMAFPFYVDMGYSKDEVAAISKVYGVLMTLAGAFIGGVLALRFGVMRILFAGAVLSAASNLLFAWLATRGHDLTGLIFVDLRGQLVGRHRVGCIHSLSIEPDQRCLLGDAIRAVLVGDVAAAQIRRRFLRRLRRRVRLRHVFSEHRVDRRARAATGLARESQRRPPPSRLAVPVVEVGVGPVHATFFKQRPRYRRERQVLARVRVFADFRKLLRADRQIFKRRIRCVDQLMRIFRAGRNTDHIALPHFGIRSPATRNVPEPSRITNISSCA